MSREYKAKISFAIIWLVVYLIGLLISNILSDLVEIPNLCTTIYRILFVLILFIYMQKKKVLSYYGICSLKMLNSKALLYYIPLGLLVIVPLVFGVEISLSWGQILLLSISALCIGFIEEILMRGFLFKALLERDKVLAIVISSFSFGLIHIVNLFGGADILYTLAQIIFTCAFGFACAMFLYKTNNIIPCILCHGLLDLCALFSTEDTNEMFMIFGLLAIISLTYGIYLQRMNKKTVKQIA